LIYNYFIGEHQYELLDYVAAKFYEEPGVFKLLVCICDLNSWFMQFEYRL